MCDTTRQVCLMLLFNIMESTQETQEVKLKPTKELRSNPLKQALKCFVTANVCKYYEVASIRALLKQGDKNEIWEARQLMEATLTNEQRVVGFFQHSLTKKYDDNHHLRKGKFIMINIVNKSAIKQCIIHTEPDI